jgi:hypothetical protein
VGRSKEKLNLVKFPSRFGNSVRVMFVVLISTGTLQTVNVVAETGEAR